MRVYERSFLFQIPDNFEEEEWVQEQLKEDRVDFEEWLNDRGTTDLMDFFDFDENSYLY